MAILDCKHAYKKKSDRAIHCKLLENEQFDYCGHQKFCPTINGYRTSEFAKDCPLRKERFRTSTSV